MSLCYRWAILIFLSRRYFIYRFAKPFDSVRAEWQVREANVVDEIIKECKIEAYEVCLLFTLCS